MAHLWKRFAACSILGVAFFPGMESSAQDNAHIRIGTVRIVETDAQSTRNELNSLLRSWYPPSLLQVLQLDTTLMSNEKFMESYPKLAEYLAQHPEVVRDPTFYLGRPDDEYGRGLQNRNSNAERVIAPILITVVTLSLIAMVTWVIRSAVDHRRWLRLSKLQTEAHAKIMERFTSNEDLLSFIQTPAGKRFLESSAIPVEPRTIGAPIGRILWSVQVGLVLFAGGLGLEFVSSRVINEVSEGFYVFGVVVMAVGIGFMLSGIASYILSRRFGLFDSPTQSFPGGGTTSGPTS